MLITFSIYTKEHRDLYSLIYTIRDDFILFSVAMHLIKAARESIKFLEKRQFFDENLASFFNLYCPKETSPDFNYLTCKNKGLF